MTLNTEQLLTGYAAAQTGAAIYRVPNPGYLRIGGADRADYIQRQTTNDIKNLTPERPLLTVLTSGTARILDVWRLVIESDSDEIGVITLAGRGAATAKYLHSRIFFKDQVTVTDSSAEFAQFEIIGPTAGALPLLHRVERGPGGEVITPPLHNVGRGSGGGATITLREDAYLTLVPADQADTFTALFLEAGAVMLGADAYNMLRIEGGLPGPAHELTDDYTPLEANLDDAISSTKGCYTGQEIIARQITYDKVARRLVGLRLEGSVQIGAAVQVEGRTAGLITSAAESPRFGSIALAMLRRPHFEPHTAVVVVSEDGRAVPGETVKLPFGQ